MPAVMSVDNPEWRIHRPTSKAHEGQDNDDDASALISQIQCKLAQGTTITKEELVELRHSLPRQNLPSLNRTFLDLWNHAPELSSSYKLVRHVGMVQDMLEPEYYVDTVQGQSMHFRDPYMDAPEQELLMQNLSERQPLVVVPVPFASEWFSGPLLTSKKDDDLSSTDAMSSIVIPESPTEASSSSTSLPSRKRDRKHDDGTTTTPSKSRVRMASLSLKAMPDMDADEAETPTSHSDVVVHGKESEWWPCGSMESNPQECPVLAKLYYEQYPQSDDHDKLRLNDIVESIGIVSMDPWDADFGGGFDDDFGALSPPLPPPSRLPRLHVLAFRRLDLDATVAAQQEESEHQQYYHDEQQGPTRESTSSSSPTITSRQDPLGAWTRYALSMDSTLSETLFLALLAKAERKDSALPGRGDMLHASTDALGCASLQFTCPDASTSQTLYQQLLQFLQQISPVVAGLDLTQTTMWSVTTNGGPSKESGRLLPNPWQLPPGSTVVIRTPNDNWEQTPAPIRAVLHEMCKQRRLTYRFEGGMQVPFDADYRVLVVSKRGLVDPLPCNIFLPVALNDADNTRMFPHQAETLVPLRRALAQGRTRTGNVQLPHAVLEQAQRDFLHRRGHARKQQQQAQTQPSARLPEEADFHRWLTLTRLYARARGASAATTGDWESALALDDAIRVLQT